MPIPDFQSVMCPLMQLLSDGKEHSMRHTVERLADHFKLSEDEREQLLPSARQEVFKNRVAWAKTHLRMAGLLEPVGRGVFKITARGLQVLQKSGDRIDLKVLQQQPGYLEARSGKRDKAEPSGQGAMPNEDRSPEKAMEEAFQSIRDNLGRELLEKLKGSSAAFFERVVVELLVRMGYGGTRRDAGQAGIIKEDRLGLDAIYANMHPGLKAKLC
jgi:restriction system protein